jgi:hypothetical protein
MTPQQQRFQQFVAERRTPGGRIVSDAMLVRRETFTPEKLSTEEGETVGRVIAKWLNLSAKATPGTGSLCLDCETEFSATQLPNSFVIFGLQKAIGKADHHMTLVGVCARCAQRTDDELLDSAVRYLNAVCTPKDSFYRLPSGGRA